MKIKYLEESNNNDNIVGGLQCCNNKLQWDESSANCFVLIVQTVYGVDATTKMDKVVEALESMDDFPNTFTRVENNEIGNKLYIRFVHPKEYKNNRGISIIDKASRYTIFGCNKEEDTWFINDTNKLRMNVKYVDVKDDVTIKVNKCFKEEKHLFKTKRVETGFYSIEFSEDINSRYYGNQIVYSFKNLDKGFEIPITEQMIKNKKFYVKSNIEPCFYTKNNGVDVKLIKGEENV